MWNANDNDYKAFDNGDYVHVEGATQLFQGNMQLIANRIRKARPDEIDEADFTTLQTEDVDQDARAADGNPRMASNPHHYRGLAQGLPGRRGVHGKILPCPRRHEKPSRVPRRTCWSTC